MANLNLTDSLVRSIVRTYTVFQVIITTATTSGVPDGDIEFQNGVTVPLSGPPPNSRRNRLIELHGQGCRAGGS